MTQKRTDSPRNVARRALRRITTDQAYATLALDAELARSGLAPRDRRLATELVYGVCRHRSRIDRAIASASKHGLRKIKPAVLDVLRVGTYQLLFLDRVPDHAAVNDAVDTVRRMGGPRLAGFANSVLRRIAREGEPALPPRQRTLEYVEAAYSLPRWIATRLAGQLGAQESEGTGNDELIACAQALCSPPPLAIRTNRTKIEPDALAHRLRAEHPGCEVEESPLCPGALVVAGLGDPELSPSFAEGSWTVQDIGAQLVGHLAGAVEQVVMPGQPGNPLRVLDACAGLGGKTTHLAERFSGHAGGVIIDAADRSAAKLALLEQARARLGLVPMNILTVDLLQDTADLAPAYDLVVLDAPCTGLGVLRRHPEAKWRVREADISAMAALQRQLLDAVCARVRPGGVLIYSVCTFTEEEGRAQIREFMARHPEFVLAPPNAAPLGTDLPDWHALCPEPGIMRTWPHRHQADAFFAARLCRMR